jgi:hypothetical protein
LRTLVSIELALAEFRQCVTKNLKLNFNFTSGKVTNHQ